MRQMMETYEARQLLSGSAAIDPIVTPTLAPIVVSPTAPGKPVAVHAEATDEFTAKVARLRGSAAKHLSELSGSINWGDGSDTSAASFQRNIDGTIAVLGTHTYANTGKFKVTVSLSHRPYVQPGKPNPFFAIFLGNIETKATVVPDVDGGVSLSEGPGRKFTEIIGSFHFRPLDIIIEKTTVDWGDGTRSNAKLIHTGSLYSGEYDVQGTHTYAAPGTYKVHVVVHTRLAGSNLPSGNAADFFSSIKVIGFV